MQSNILNYSLLIFFEGGDVSLGLKTPTNCDLNIYVEPVYVELESSVDYQQTNHFVSYQSDIRVWGSKFDHYIRCFY